MYSRVPFSGDLHDLWWSGPEHVLKNNHVTYNSRHGKIGMPDSSRQTDVLKWVWPDGHKPLFLFFVERLPTEIVIVERYPI